MKTVNLKLDNRNTVGEEVFLEGDCYAAEMALGFAISLIAKRPGKLVQVFGVKFSEYFYGRKKEKVGL